MHIRELSLFYNHIEQKWNEKQGNQTKNISRIKNTKQMKTDPLKAKRYSQYFDINTM